MIYQFKLNVRFVIPNDNEESHKINEMLLPKLRDQHDKIEICV